MTKLLTTTIAFVFMLLFPNIGKAQQLKTTKFEVIKTEKLKSHILLTVANLSDTLIVVAKKKTAKRDIKKKLANLNYKNCPTICELEDDGKKILFTYKTVNATIGCGPPGLENVKYINSYDSFPIILEECK